MDRNSFMCGVRLRAEKVPCSEFSKDIVRDTLANIVIESVEPIMAAHILRVKEGAPPFAGAETVIERGVSMTKSGRTTLWIVAVLIAIFVYWKHSESQRPVMIDEAVHSGKASVQITANGGNGESATLDIARGADLSGNLTVVVPLGTVLYSSNSGTQRLMTAVPLTVVLTDQNPSVSLIVATYCLDEFAAVPAGASTLSIDALPGGEGGITTEEMEQLHKLTDCMTSYSLSPDDRQLAVWAVGEDLLSKTRPYALDLITSGLIDRMSKERRDQLEAKRPQLQEMGHDLSDGQISEILDAEYQNGMPQLRRVAAEKANEQLTSIIDHDKDMLNACGYQTAHKTLLQ